MVDQLVMCRTLTLEFRQQQYLVRFELKYTLSQCYPRVRKSFLAERPEG